MRVTGEKVDWMRDGDDRVSIGDLFEPRVGQRPTEIANHRRSHRSGRNQRLGKRGAPGFLQQQNQVDLVHCQAAAVFRDEQAR